ncbi:MAG TPA: DUF5684 domain-containing protein [Candidatus Saccharimonadales bacterium]|nr:DUF5684 domain-containing protein [Candidatus Saccharimonadales bacterium]
MLLFNKPETSLLLVKILFAMPLIFAAWKHVKGVLLPYAVSAGVAIAVLSIKFSLDETSSVARHYIPVFSGHTDGQILIASFGGGLLLALLAFVTLNYGSRLSRATANIVFRILAVWMILFFGSTAHLIVDRADYRTKQVDYEQSKITYQQTTLNNKLELYDPILPANYRKSTVYATDNSSKHASYAVVYSSGSRSGADITVAVSLGKISGSCDNSMTPRIKIDGSKRSYSCNIVLRSDDGQDVYGYRYLSNLKYQGIDPKTLSPDELKHIQPSIFYIQKSDNLISLEYGTQNNGSSPLNAVAVGNFADSLNPLDANAKEKFINKFIKPAKPIKPQGPNNVYRDSVMLSFIFAAYLAIFLWAIENVFKKAGRKYWQTYVPVMNLWVLTKIAGRPGWWSLLAYLDTNPYSAANTQFLLRNAVLSPVLIPLMTVMTLIRFILFILVSTSMAKRFGKPKLFSILLIIPPFPGYLILGFDKSRYIQELHKSAVENLGD